MAKGVNQKQKMLHLVEIFRQETDEDHDLTLEQITALLNARGVNADRKTLYLDFQELRNYGLEIAMEQRERTFFYKLVSRDFELAELKLLVESVQASKFITVTKSSEIIAKLEKLCSRYEARQLNRQLYIPDRIKSMNKSIIYTVDFIHRAINDNKMITFRYLQWNVKKKLVPKHEEEYLVSPLSLVLDNENYYLVGYDVKAGKKKHFRVDKMQNTNISSQSRQGVKSISKKELAQYTSRVFNMYGGEKKHITLDAPNDMVGVFLDRFGKNAGVIEKADNTFRLTAEVELSPQFLGWLVGLGPRVKLISPAEVVDQLRELVQELNKKYN